MQNTPELKLYFYESGPKNAPAILFLHGSPLSGRMWQPQLEQLTQFHCLAVDLPEHGKSAAIAPFDMKDTVRRLVDLIKASSPSGRAHVVGLSFGGVVAQALLSQAPEVVDQVILSGTAARSGKTFQTILKVYLELNRPFLALLPPAWISGLVTWQFGIPRQYTQAMSEDIQIVKGNALSRLVYSTYCAIETPVRPASPVLVVVGEKETFAAKMMARRLKRDIQNAKAVIAPGATHVWNLQQTALFNSLLRAWLCDQALPAQFIPLN